MQCRFRGFIWNLHEHMNGTWRVSEVHPRHIQTTRFELSEAFANAHDEEQRPFEQVIWEDDDLSVIAITMDHRTPSLAYLVREKPRQNIDMARLAELGLQPGPWLGTLKNSANESATVDIDGTPHSVAELRDNLLYDTPGGSIAYLTDFRLDDAAQERLAAALQGCHTIVCEGQYRHADLELARKHFHMTVTEAATLAREVSASNLVLFHLSNRYDRAQWLEMLAEAREIFPATRFSDHWNLEGSSSP